MDLRTSMRQNGFSNNDDLGDYEQLEVKGKEIIGLKYEYDVNISGYHMYPEIVKIVYPLKDKSGRIIKLPNGKPKLQLKRIAMESYKDDHIKSYWDYVEENGDWKVYRVIKGISRKLVAIRCIENRPDLIEAQIFSKEISATGYKDIEDQKRNPNRRYSGLYDIDNEGRRVRTSSTNKWCVKYDKWPIFIVMKEHPKMSYNDIKNVIENEGGTVDEQGFISANGIKNEIVKY